MGAPHRRTIYLASLEAHIDRLHEQLLSYSLAPVPFEKLEPYRGLNAKTAKVRLTRGPLADPRLTPPRRAWSPDCSTTRRRSS